MSKKTKKKKTTKSVKKKKFGVFGGTFNPIHYGHMNSLETVLSEALLDKIFIVPANQNPLREKLTNISNDERLKMIEIGLEALEHKKDYFEICKYELDRGGASYTIETLKELKKANKNSELYLIIGADQLNSFHLWKDYRDIIKTANLIVTSRYGEGLPESKQQIVEGLSQEIKSFKNGKGTFKSGKKLAFIVLNDMDISSSEIRKKIRMGDSIASLTPGPLVEYIQKNNLYKSLTGKISDYGAFLKFCYKILDDKGAGALSSYDVTMLEQPTDYTIIGSGTSQRHTKALSEHVVGAVKKEYGVYPLAIEGSQEGRWVVVDYGALMIHLFYDYVRSEYRIEDLWREGKRLDL